MRVIDGLSTPVTTTSRASSSSTFKEENDPTASERHDSISIYNGTLRKKAGRIIAIPVTATDGPGVARIDATTLPTPSMLANAARTPLCDTPVFFRHVFLQKLQRVKKVYLENKVDDTSPPLHFTFIDKYVFREGVYQPDEDAFEGCQHCRPNMGQNVGCEYTQKCDCLEYAAVDEEKLRATNPAAHRDYVHCRENGLLIDTLGMPKRFPYSKPSDDPNIPQKLLAYYREQRHPIYECNQNCRCGPRCKSRLVQKGRKVPLTIFKTRDGRGWGVYCKKNLVQGEFIDTYLGEVITSEEADRRERAGGMEKNSYLYSLDKFVDGDDGVTSEDCFVVDGQYMGGPTRFINHSCEPNCRQYTVSYNRHDNRVYNLAFFAYTDIPAGTELTFDYQDEDEMEEDEAIRRREQSANDPRNRGRVPCNCGARKCRGFLWDS